MKILVQYVVVTVFALTLVSSCQEETLTPNDQVIPAKTKVLVAVGRTIYENVDALVRVKAYDAASNLRWQRDYSYTGPEDILMISDGFDHYQIELVDKWGISDITSDILRNDLLAGRADGDAPITFTLGGSISAQRLQSVTVSNEVRMPNNTIVYVPSLRDIYTYNNFGQLELIRHQIYNTMKASFEEGSAELFGYEGVRVTNIKITQPNGAVDKEYVYEYALDFGRASKITETNFTTGFVTTQFIEKDYAADHPKVLMTENFSNGNFLAYDFDVEFNNIVSDKTTANNELCSSGSYGYDKNINPFHHLGYMDFGLRNWPANNKMTSNVNFIGCGFPSLIPVFHTFTYRSDGYPSQMITTYKSASNSTTVLHTKTDFSYE